MLGYRKNNFSGSPTNGNSSEHCSEGYKTPESSGYGSTVLNKKRKKNIFTQSIINRALPIFEKKRCDSYYSIVIVHKNIILFIHVYCFNLPFFVKNMSMCGY